VNDMIIEKIRAFNRFLSGLDDDSYRQREELELKCIEVGEFASSPRYGTEYSACFDFTASIECDEVKGYDSDNNKFTVKPTIAQGCAWKHIVIQAGDRVLIPTGFIFEFDPAYSLRIHPRSSLPWKHGVTIANCEGIVDADYPNETFVMLWNTSTKPFTVTHGDRIAQGELVPVERVNITRKYGTFSNTTDRTGGLGSTGK